MDADKQEKIVASVLRSIVLANYILICAAIHQALEFLEIQIFHWHCTVMKYKEVCANQCYSLSSACANYPLLS